MNSATPMDSGIAISSASVAAEHGPEDESRDVARERGAAGDGGDELVVTGGEGRDRLDGQEDRDAGQREQDQDARAGGRAP